jgi:TrmH family RNA methyltransferase
MMAMAPNLRIVLVETSHPGNIGAVARAMKTMGLHDLRLVRPKRFPCAEATARAAGADDVLFDARVSDTLEASLRGCTWVVATSARTRSIAWPELEPRIAALQMVSLAQARPVALVFGREHSGLTNDELDRCHALVRIPSDPAFRSLNLAGAVQILAYEVYLAGRDREEEEITSSTVSSPRVTAEEMEGFYRHLEATLVDIGYLNPTHPKRLMRRLRRMFNRMQPEHAELNVLRGILKGAQQASETGREGRGGGKEE